MRLGALALALVLCACGESEIVCADWSLKEEVISLKPYLVGTVKRCKGWRVKESESR